MSKNAEGWIRHRGGKCPVEAGVRVDVRWRDGSTHEGVYAVGGLSAGRWVRDEYTATSNDIMAYRLHKPAEQVEACSKPEIKVTHIDHEAGIIHAESASSSCGNLKAEWHEVKEEGPLKWRDRIAEIDATTQALTAERAELVQKLASEGFALIGRVGDMSDSKKWMVGDLFTVDGGDDHGFDVGDKVVLAENDGTSRLLFTREGKESWVDTDCVKFHSRPSA